MVLANKNLRVNEEEEGGFGADFDPKSVLSSNKTGPLIKSISRPAVEDVLMSRTLWPESQKLYGHIFEIFCITASHKGDCAASACKAKQEQYADIIIWKIIQNDQQNQDGGLISHQSSVPACKLSGMQHLTVVQMEFSKND